ncbi:MAG: S24 family peptidase [Alphaproteobacteria bacterium]
MSEDGPGSPSFRAELGLRLREVENRFRNRADAAAAAGVAKSSLQRWIEGKSDASFEGLARLAEASGVSLDWLARGRGDIDAGGSTPSSAVADRKVPYVSERTAEFVFVPRYDIRASAGPGAWLDDEHILDHMAFRADWVRRTLGADPRRLALIAAVGDSMEPVIRAGDLLLVDTSVDRIVDDAIYVIGIDDTVMVKRIQRFFGGAVTVKSDNPAYVEQTLDRARVDQLHVAGRVRWIGRLI